MRILMLTGAGISAGAGLATYRGADGQYVDIEKKYGLPVERLLTGHTIQRNPDLFWDYWWNFYAPLKEASPSRAHASIVEMARDVSDFLELTQNIDGLSLKAGLRADQLIEIHGSAHKYHCMRCSAPHDLGSRDQEGSVPRCRVCKGQVFGVIRPSVVMFEENIPSIKQTIAKDFARQCDLLIISGTTLQFPYLLEFITPVIRAGKPVAYVDPEASPYQGVLFMADWELDMTRSIITIRKTADEVLPAIAEGLRDLRQGGGNLPANKVWYLLHQMKTRFEV